MRNTHTFATLGVAQSTFDDVKGRILSAYEFHPPSADHYLDHTDGDGNPSIHLGEIALVAEKAPFKVMSMEEVVSEVGAHRKRMDEIFHVDKEEGMITINAVYPYIIELSRIPDPAGLMQWLVHLFEKTWMTAEIADEFIRRVYAFKGWDLYERSL